MNTRISKPIECIKKPLEIDVAIVGSGYGAAIAATRLAGPGRRVVVLERGREYELGDFPVGLGEVPGHVRFHRADSDDAVGYADALFDIRLGGDVDVLVGSGLGGTSLINANVAMEPDDAAFANWPSKIREDLPALRQCFVEVKTLLGITASQPARKTEALRQLSRELKADFSAAQVAVTFGKPGTRTTNEQGVEQSPCTKCGNCVTGCNVGAKNTLMMNALPLARARGAELYTGVTILSIRANPGSKYRWILRARRTQAEKTHLRDEVFELAARDVILAAGTLGSSEILKRSAEMHGLRLSGALGNRFSGNGDGLAFGYGQRARVNAMGTAQQFVPESAQNAGVHEYDVGPTITAVVQKKDAVTGRQLTIEEGAIPHSLRRIFGEIVTTGAYFHRLQDGTLPAWHARAQARDPVISSSGALDHSQVLLLMGDDGAAGRLAWRMPSGDQHAADPDRARMVVEWPKAAKNASLEFADELLNAQDRAAGFDDGQYVPNPLWRAMPKEAAGVMSGTPPGGRTLTVHPLGGCAMGENAHTGVVNHAGEVFLATPDMDGKAVHEGLFVLDGSIVPGALGVNPFLTISALSWRAAERLRLQRGWQLSGEKRAPAARESAVAAAEARQVAQKHDPTQVVLRERLCGTLESMPDWLRKVLPEAKDPRWRKDPDRWIKDRGFVVEITMEVKDLDSYLDQGTGQAIPATTRVWANPVDAGFTERSHMDHTPDDHLTSVAPLATGFGKAWMLAPEHVSTVRRTGRMFLALYAYHRRRKSLGRFIEEQWQQRNDEPARDKIGFWKGLKGLLNVAWQHGLYRQFRYELKFREGGLPEGRVLFELKGMKRLAYRVDERRLWDALMKLDFKVSSGGNPVVKGAVNVDLTYLATSGLPQVRTSPHLPATVEGMAGVGALFARSLLQTHFWEFGAPDYEKSPDPQPVPQQPPLLTVGNIKVKGVKKDYYAPISAKDPRKLRLRLTRYAQENEVQPVLLVHGLAQGSLIFSTDTLEKNMAASLWEAGYDVWLVDYRLSNLLPQGPDPARGQIPFEGWSMEEVGIYDIPNAIDEIYDACGQQRVRIFAHCVGATAVALGILEGKLKKTQVECVAFNAIHPWIMPSSVNESRAKLGSFFRDLVGDDYPLDPIPEREPNAAQVMFDRLGFSLARYQEQEEERSARRHERSLESEFAEAVCDRMTFLYGRMWKHKNLDPRTHAAFPQLVGRAPGEVYRHLYYFAIRQRITDRDGQNIYLTEEKLKNWEVPTFFFHGEDSMVFNPQSATRSAVRLDAFLNPDPAAAVKIPVGVLRVPGYGHMDVVFADTAHEKVYPTLKAFFHAPLRAHGDAWSANDDIHMLLMYGITAGPVLRAAWSENGTICLRYWAETNDEATTLIRGVELAGNAKQRDQWEPEPTEARYRLLDAELVDQEEVRFDILPKALGRIIHAEEERKMEQLRNDPAMAHHAPLLAEAHAHPKPPLKYVYPKDLAWLQRLREATGKPCEDMRFLVGSCRYPGTPFERDAADAIFEGMARHVDVNLPDPKEPWPGVHMLFLVGDQIYADATANILDTQQWRERFGGRYRAAFTSRHARHLLTRIPTHFAIDDHEIADDWSGDPSGAAPEEAMRSARSFQSSGRDRSQLPTSPTACRPLWYSLAHAAEHCCPAFVMDTRSERHLRRDGQYDAQFVSEEQLKALETWLRTANAERPDEPKFIFCGIGFAPVSREYSAYPQAWRSQDGWLGYPEALAHVARIIADEQIPHVFFVSGDLHLSSASRLTFTTARRSIAAWHIVASGLYAPMPFANAQPRDFEWNQSLAVKVGRNDPVEIEMESGLLYKGEPHCLRVDAVKVADRWIVWVWVVGADGNPLDPLQAAPRDVGLGDHGWMIDLGAELTPSRAPKRIETPAESDLS